LYLLQTALTFCTAAQTVDRSGRKIGGSLSPLPKWISMCGAKLLAERKFKETFPPREKLPRGDPS